MANQPGSTAPRGTSEEIQLRGRARRRLVGAIALVVLIVVILPMVLDEEPKPVGQDIAINIPSQQSTEVSAKIVPAGPVAPVAAAKAGGIPQLAESAPVAVKPPEPAPVQPAQAPAGSRAGAAEPAKALAAEVPVKPARVVEPSKAPAAETPVKVAKPADAPKAAVKETPAKAAASADKPKKEDKAHSSEKADKGGFVVQLGVFSSAANVKQLQAKLAGRGIHSYTETLKTEAGNKIRLRAGPYASRQEAEKVRDKLKSAGENGIVVANK